jgi:hypothetical protein
MTGLPPAAHGLSSPAKRRANPLRRLPLPFLIAALAVLLLGCLPVVSHSALPYPAPTVVQRLASALTHPDAATPGPTPSWAQVSTQAAPPAQLDELMAYDARDGYTVLFGALLSYPTSSRVDDYTWTYRDGVWTNLPTSGPNGVGYYGMAYDPADGYVVLVGGVEDCEPCNQTWTFSGGKWTDLDIAGPPPRVDGTFAWDPALGEMILTGGAAPFVVEYLTDTWSFVHGIWSNLSVPGPSHRAEAAMAYVPAAGGLILFGGEFETNTPAGQLTYDDTWLFNGRWTNLSISGPPARMSAQMTYEPTSGLGVLYGGYYDPPTGGNVKTLGDTWIFNGASWEQLNISGPPPRFFPEMVYDAADGYDMVFGGQECSGFCESETFYNDTWSFSLGAIAASLSVAVSPAAICVFEDHSCAAGTWTAQVRVSVQPMYEGLPTGVAALTDPDLFVLPWGEIEINESSHPLVSCESDLRFPDSCDFNATVLSYGNATGFQINWSADPLLNSLYVGQLWTVAFNITAAGPPYGSLPVYACTTGPCLAGGSGTIGARFSCLSFQPLAAASEENDSLPYANITVDPPRIPPGGSSSPTTNVPPPPPPPTGLPNPVTTPSPVLIPTPVLTALAVGVPTISISAAAAGILSAGFARVVLQRRSVAVGQPVGNAVRGKRSAFEGERPTDPTIGRLD